MQNSLNVHQNELDQKTPRNLLFPISAGQFDDQSDILNHLPIRKVSEHGFMLERPEAIDLPRLEMNATSSPHQYSAERSPEKLLARQNDSDYELLKVEPEFLSNGFQQMLESRSIPRPSNYRDPDLNHVAKKQLTLTAPGSAVSQLPDGQPGHRWLHVADRLPV